VRCIVAEAEIGFNFGAGHGGKFVVVVCILPTRAYSAIPRKDSVEQI